MNTIEILKKARALLSDPDNWAQGDYAFLSENDGALNVDWKSPIAACWCPAGALLKVSQGQAAAALVELAQGLPSTKVVFLIGDSDKEIDQIATWNDAPERTHAEVLQHFDEAIARLAASVSERKTIWLCGACGKTGEARMTVGDESCYLNSVEVFVDSIQRDLNGRIKTATVVPRVDQIERKDSAG